MKTNNEAANDSRKLIAFRPDKEFKDAFWRAVDALGVSSTDLARRALAIGLQQAADEIAKEQEKSLSQRLKTLRRGVSISLPTQNMGSEWESPVLMAVP